MRLKNRNTCCDLRSENPHETSDLLTASIRSYSPRVAAITIDDCRELVITRDECQEFASGVIRDVDISSHGKWQLAKLIACWASNEITDEAIA